MREFLSTQMTASDLRFRKEYPDRKMFILSQSFLIHHLLVLWLLQELAGNKWCHSRGHEAGFQQKFPILAKGFGRHHTLSKRVWNIFCLSYKYHHYQQQNPLIDRIISASVVVIFRKY